MEVAPKNDINGHISQEILSQLIQKESFSLKSLVLKTHLKKCQRCNEIINIKNYLQQIAGRTKPTENKSHPEVSDLHDSIARIYDSSLSKQEAADFLHHISSCSQCFEYVSFVLEDSLTPVPEEIEKQIDSLANVSLAEMVLNEVPPQESIFQKLLSKIKKSVDKIKEVLGSIIIPEPKQAPDPAMGLAIPQLRSVFGPAIRIAIPVSLLAVISFIILINIPETSPYTYDNKVPFVYNVSSLRGTTETASEDPEFQAFSNRFTLAISDYMLLDYEKVITRLESIESSANSMKTIQDQKRLAIIRDFYFYLGVSHFALSRSESRQLSEETKIVSNKKAISYLLQSQSIASEKKLKFLDRDTFFLGLAYGFVGEKEKALLQLKMLKPDGEFYGDSVGLIKKWSKK